MGASTAMLEALGAVTEETPSAAMALEMLLERAAPLRPCAAAFAMIASAATTRAWNVTVAALRTAVAEEVRVFPAFRLLVVLSQMPTLSAYPAS